MDDKLMMIVFEENNEHMYCEMSEYYEICEVLQYFGQEHTDYIVEERVWRITWYDYIDEEWSDLWCTNEESYMITIEDVREAEVEYRVKIYN
jgi:hypothetical protein